MHNCMKYPKWKYFRCAGSSGEEKNVCRKFPEICRKNGKTSRKTMLFG